MQHVPCRWEPESLELKKHLTQHATWRGPARPERRRSHAVQRGRYSAFVHRMPLGRTGAAWPALAHTLSLAASELSVFAEELLWPALRKLRAAMPDIHRVHLLARNDAHFAACTHRQVVCSVT